ncbi:MAG: urease accessory UreF family protein [Pseudomonadota bacterium]
MTASTRDLIRLQTFMSASFPLGGFAYSQGLESAVHNGLVGGEDDLCEWISGFMTSGSARNDAIVLAAAYRNEDSAEGQEAICDLARALAQPLERYLETLSLGQAFCEAIQPWPFSETLDLPEASPFPVAVGIAAADLAIPLEAAIASFLQSFVSNQTQAAIRLSLIGQTGAQRVIVALEDEIVRLSNIYASSGLDDLGGLSFQSDIMASRHEHQAVRLFRS